MKPDFVNKVKTFKIKKMKTTSKLILICLCIIIPLNIFSQESSGIIQYTATIKKTHVDNFLAELKQKDMPMQIKQGVVEMYMNATPDEYILNFINGESFYYHNPSLESEENYNIGSKAGKNSYYTDISNIRIIEISPTLGNIAQKPLNWEISGKSKTIGKYKCIQAVATEKLYSRQGHYYDRKVIAWFTPEIPLSYGPKNYNGLPGLILEIERDEFKIEATKVNLNPKHNSIIIKKISDKNIITQEEANGRIKELMDDRKKSR